MKISYSRQEETNLKETSVIKEIHYHDVIINILSSDAKPLHTRKVTI